MIKSNNRIWLYKDVLDSFKSKQGKGTYSGVFKSGEDLLLSDGKTVSYIPIDKIKNSRTVGFDELTVLSREDDILDFLDRSNYTSLGSVKVNELNKLLLEEHVEFLIHKTHRKLKQHECSQRVYNCSIAQGLLLGRDYDHCGNCISNEGKDVDNVRMNKYVSMIKRKGINKRMAENLSDKIRGSSMWQYFPLIGKDTVKWMGRVFGNIKMEVSYFGEKNEGFFREVDSGKSKDLIKENELANQHKIFHFFNSDSNVRLINISNVKRQEKRNWPSD